MPTRARVANRFDAIRKWDGSQNRGFEELCFQLRDPTPPDAELVKTSAPDAGVEWYWRHPDGTETGWQVKYISRTDNLLKAMRESLKAAAQKRPGLRKLTFCTPYDLADDPSHARGKQARERFEEAVAHWKQSWPEIEVGLLSGGHLLERLAREEHRGREWFFFGERILGKEWCKGELDGTIEDAGDRYTPTQNVDLPIDRVLEAVVLRADFESHVRGLRDAVLSKARELVTERIAGEQWSEPLGGVRAALADLERLPLVISQPPGLDTGPLRQAVDAAERQLGQFAEMLRPFAWPDDGPDKPGKTPTEAEQKAAQQRERHRYRAQSLWSRCRKVEHELAELDSFLRGPTHQAAEARALFVEGPAGRGKTHLVCDVGERLLAEGHPVVVLLGERFRDSSPWTTLARCLGDPSLGPEEIAGIFAASGEASGRRAALFIDAINEAGDPTMWATELADIRRRLTASGWVGFAVSCRSTYLDLVKPPTGPDEAFARVEHVGYRGREFEATAAIFAAHGVQQPRVPLLIPEFTNPLFLKLYCQGLKDEPSASAGSHHLSAVFDRFVAGREARIERKLQLNPHLDVVGRATTAFAERLGNDGREELPYDEAAALVDCFAPHLHKHPDTLLETMHSEGLIAVERGWIEEQGTRAEVVSFPYQRFSDHLVLGAFLDRHLPTADPEAARAAFAHGEPLAVWLQDAPGGLIEALAVQLPERWGLELPDLTESLSEDDGWSWLDHQTWEGFTTSLVTRDRTAFNDRTEALINEGLRVRAEAVVDALISVAPDPDHPYNGAGLHRCLARMPLPDRDAYWSKLTYHAFGQPARSLDRLVRWAARGPYPAYPDEVVELACVPLAWLLTSPNRLARDYAIKALASVLIGRTVCATRIVERFARVDDPYVIQGIAAAVLGSITRGPEVPSPGVAEQIMDTLLSCFVERDGSVPDILTRDYIGSLACWLRRRGAIRPRTLRRASPPYDSRPPKTARTKAHLEKTYPRSDDRAEGYGTILYSALSSHSDWAHYVVSGRVDNFLPVRLGEPLPEPEEPKVEVRVSKPHWKRFVESLRPEQLDLLQDDDEGAQLALSESLTGEQAALLQKAFMPPRRSARTRPRAYPPERVNRFIFQRCIELGWTPERFGQFDASIARFDHGRDSHKPERFGKKYQWMALYELLARLADNFVLEEWREPVAYEGARQLRMRDLDPTLRPERIAVGEHDEHTRSPTFPVDPQPAWWSPEPPSFAELVAGQEREWAELRADLPSPEGLLRVTDPDGRQWLIVDGYHNWRDDPEDAASVITEAGPDRDVAILTHACLIRGRDLGRLRAWLAENPDLVRSLPDWHSQGLHEAFWSELPAEADTHGYPGGWRRRGGEGRLPVSSAAVHLGYTAEGGGRDGSITSTANIEMPSKFVAALAGLRWDESENTWADEHGRAFAQYRETDEGFHRDRVLMFSERELAELLAEHELVLAIGLFSERRVFDRSERSIPEALGWVDYSGHLLFDGTRWTSLTLHPIERHGRSAD